MQKLGLDILDKIGYNMSAEVQKVCVTRGFFISRRYHNLNSFVRQCAPSLCFSDVGKPRHKLLGLSNSKLKHRAAHFVVYAPERENPKMRTQSSAMKFVERAIKSGNLTRPERCEVCATKPTEGYKKHATVAHHWNGYDDPLNIWWVCHSCNRFLAYKHDGSLTKEEARVYVRARQRARLWNYSITEEIQ